MMSVKYLLSFFGESDVIRLVDTDYEQIYMGSLGMLPYSICKDFDNMQVVECEVLSKGESTASIPYLEIVYR